MAVLRQAEVRVRIWAKTGFDIALTVAAVAIAMLIFALIVQNQRTAAKAEDLAIQLRANERVAARATVETCYQRNASATLIRKLVIALENSPEHARDPVIREAAETYIANLSSVTPRISDCQQLANNLEVSK